jgi:hypothetical protein
LEVGLEVGDPVPWCFGLLVMVEGHAAIWYFFGFREIRERVRGTYGLLLETHSGTNKLVKLFLLRGYTRRSIRLSDPPQSLD